jgi:hypothetical protein
MANANITPEIGKIWLSPPEEKSAKETKLMAESTSTVRGEKVAQVTTIDDLSLIMDHSLSLPPNLSR